MNQNTYRKLVSGQTAGKAAAALCFLLAAVSRLYLIVIGLRNFLYDKKYLKTYSVDATVICIGNITAGGTGKTPLVIWLYNFLNEKGLCCAILTRGYKATPNLKLKTENYNDEPAILAKSCPQAKVIVNPNRFIAATKAVNQFDAKVLIMDDGFQHRRLTRNLDVLTIDATQPFGYGKLLPAGLLREPVSALKRAGAVVITRCDQITEAQLSQIEQKLRLANPNMIISTSQHKPICAVSMGDKKISIEWLKDKKIFAFCGIGNPDAFLKTITSTGLNLVGSKVYSDHYSYSSDDIRDVYKQAKSLNADLILSTQKDWTKTALLASTEEDLIFAYLAIDLKFISGEDKLKSLIEETLHGKITYK